MKIILFAIAVGLLSCGIEKEESDNGRIESIDEVRQITNQADIPAAEKLPRTLIARVKVDADGKVVGQPETRRFDGSISQFANNDPAVAEAFQVGDEMEYKTLDTESSTSQHHRWGRGWYYWNTNWYYPQSYYRYYYPSYSSYYYVNYTYTSYYRYGGYRYYCYTPFWY